MASAAIKPLRTALSIVHGNPVSIQSPARNAFRHRVAVLGLVIKPPVRVVAFRSFNNCVRTIRFPAIGNKRMNSSVNIRAAVVTDMAASAPAALVVNCTNRSDFRKTQ